MYNEELALLVQQGDSEALPLLWEKTCQLITRMAKQYHYFLDGNKYGVEIDDLIQEGYFALLNAVKYYKPEKGYAFTTYLTYTLKNAFKTAKRIRGGHNRDALNYATSLDMPVGEEGDNTMVDFITDETAEAAYDALIVEDIAQIILATARGLSNPNEWRIIFECVYLGRTFESMADELGVSPQAVYGMRDKAIKYIRHRPIIRTIRYEFYCESKQAKRESAIDPYRIKSTTSFKSDFTSVVEAIVLRTEGDQKNG
jgi:RNA polymerase sporulation-specific sigma factor